MHTLKLSLPLLGLLFVLHSTAFAQRAPADRKSIQISATEKVQVAAEIAILKIGYRNDAESKDATYAENTRIANKILQALLDAGIPKDAIETETLNLMQQDQQYFAKSNGPARYSANQQWQIRSKAAEAQKIVDIAVAAGANEIESLEWSVLDPNQLETKAYAAALKRAKDLAEQTASQAGLKLGEILSITNSVSTFPSIGRAANAEMYDFSLAAPKKAMLKLQPGTVERDASITVTYAILQ